MKLLSPEEIAALTSSQVEKIFEEVKAGDENAATNYLLWTGWRDIRGREEFSDKEKAEAFVHLCSLVKVDEVEVTRG